MEITVELRELHQNQLKVTREAKRFNVLQCGRRWGKTSLGINLLAETALDGFPAGWFAPNYKYLDEVWIEAKRVLAPVIASKDEQRRRIDLITGGIAEFWTLDSEDPGRSRAYKRVLIDESSIVRNLQTIWQEAIRPTLTDYRGGAWFFGTPKGRDYFHQLYTKGETNDPDWASWRMPTSSNPFIDKNEIEAARKDMPPAIFNQEYLGIPADDGGNPFGIPAIQACLAPMSTKEPIAWGIDLAKSYDYTVPIGLDADGVVCRMDRWQSDWGATTRKLVDLLQEIPGLIDSTGVGDPIVEEIGRAKHGVEGFKFTQQSKQQLMEGLASAIQRGEVKFPAGWLVNELESFTYEIRPGGTVRYTAPQGYHDDGVCALALAVECRNRRLRNRPFVKIHETGGGQPAKVPIFVSVNNGRGGWH